jgi:hypothetical protein
LNAVQRQPAPSNSQSETLLEMGQEGGNVPAWSPETVEPPQLKVGESVTREAPTSSWVVVSNTY